EFARDGGLVLGICNGFQVLCEAGLLPGALLPNVELRFICRQVELEVVTADTPFTREAEPGQRLSIPIKHTTGRYFAPDLDAIDVGDGLAVAFKVESHNHPSAVEPFQGAATGVGGILRDVVAVGARPIAVLDSLRFGDPSSERSRYLLDHAFAGIGHYGNSIGVPTVGGEVYFEA